MEYIISFLEGVITFVSPCLLPMLPVYLSYFTGGEQNKGRTIKNATAFVIGFTTVFVLMGAFAGSIGMVLQRYNRIVNLICGSIVTLFGLSMLGLIKINLFKGIGKSAKADGFISSVIFGMVFSVGWTPCVGAFLGSALLLASTQGSVLKGVVMLLCYSLGLGIPFMVSAVLLDKLKETFDWIKGHYLIINRVSGGFLVAMGVLMMTGIMGRFLNLLAI